MPNDQYGRPIAVGDTVTIKGEVVKVLDSPNYVNCTVKLAQQMPPAGTETKIQVNTAQVEKQGGGDKQSGKVPAERPSAQQPHPTQPPSPPPPPPLQPPPLHGAKKETK